MQGFNPKNKKPRYTKKNPATPIKIELMVKTENNFLVVSIKSSR
jgi:hypothetical protein